MAQTVLVVEDEVKIRELLRSYLEERAGWLPVQPISTPPVSDYLSDNRSANNRTQRTAPEG